MTLMTSSLGGNAEANVEEQLLYDSNLESLPSSPSLGGNRSETPHLGIDKSEDAVKQAINDESTEPSTTAMYTYEEPQLNSKEIDVVLEKITDTALTMPQEDETKIEEILQKYENEILLLHRELGVLRNDYLDRTINLNHCEKTQTDAEERESTNHLIQNMKNLERKARGAIPSTQHPDIEARQARIKLWDAVIKQRNTSELMYSVESELWQLETITPMLKYERDKGSKTWPC